MEPIYNLGIEIIVYIQGLGEWLLEPMKFFSFLGLEYFYFFLLPALYWCINASLGIRVGVLLIVSVWLNSVFKITFHEPRPYWISRDVIAYIPESSFGVPSGHAQNAVVIWGAVAAWINRWWSWLIGTLLILMIGISRLYLGVHFLHDVVVGWIIGLIILLLYLGLDKRITDWFNKLSTKSQIFIVTLISLSFILISGLITQMQASWQFPDEWLENITYAFPDEDPFDPFTLTGVISNAGVFFGLAIGVIIIKLRGGFNAKGVLMKRVLRFIIGVIGVAILYLGLDAIFPDGETLFALGYRFFRYAIVGLWVTGLAPMLFIRLGIAEPDRMINEQ